MADSPQKTLSKCAQLSPVRPGRSRTVDRALLFGAWDFLAALRAPRAAILHHPNQRDELPADLLHHCLGTGERQGWDRDVENAYSTFSSTFSKMIS